MCFEHGVGPCPGLMPQPNDRVEAPPNDIIDAIPADLPSDTAGMQRVVNIHITLCEQCQTLHYDPCLKYLFASTYPTTSRLEAQAAAENNDGTSSKDDAIWQQIYQAAATINPIAPLEPRTLRERNGSYNIHGRSAGSRRQRGRSQSPPARRIYLFYANLRRRDQFELCPCYFHQQRRGSPT